MRFSRILCSALLLGWAGLGRAEVKPTPVATPQPKASPAAANPAPAPAESYIGQLSLVRYDLPLGNSDGYAPTRQLARKKAGEDSVDWPDFTFNGQPVFRTQAEERLPLKLRAGAEAASPFQLRTDDVILPGNHWLRAMNWRGGRRHIYTAERNARTANWNETMAGRYELWTYPVRISGEGGPGVKNVVIKSGATIVYKKDGPWRTLTLLLPATEAGRPYELSVDGRPPIRFELGLMPVKLGAPREHLYALDAMVSGDGPKVHVVALPRPDTFPNPKEWDADVAALKQPAPALVKFDRPGGFARYVGVEVPRSPLTLYAAQLPFNLSGGFYKQGPTGFGGTPEEYAAHIADLGFDAVFDQANSLPGAGDPNGFEARAAALARHGVKLGLQYDNNYSRPSLQHPCLPIFAHTLPEWHAPLYRSLSLAAQRFTRLPNFLGLCVGALSSGYAADWYPAPPSPDRPWGEAMIEFMGKAQPSIPRAPQSGPPQLPIEYVAKSTDDFLKYVQRYDAAFQEYEYFAEAVRQAAGRLVFTTASFGSGPGPGARGGWPWASLPGRSIFGGMNVQQAFDLNQTHAAKPMENEAITDRISSYWDKKTTWSLLDNYQLLYGREGYERACALALTRGIQGVGTNFLPTRTGNGARPEVVPWMKEMNDWMHRFGGVYANLEPVATIGIFYGQHQAVQRPVMTEEKPADDRVYDGSQEGKVTEALFLCHAAGWPARVITYQEIMRGTLPPSMRAILVVGGGLADGSWNWGAGLDKPLQNFLARGGRLFVDGDSVAPIAPTKIDLKVAAYQPQSNLDATPLLFHRNGDNIKVLRSAMEGLPHPVAQSDEPTIWAIPAETGDVQYVTVVNQGFAEGDETKEMVRQADPRASTPEIWKSKANASLYVRPQSGALTWSTTRPIYDLRLGRKITAEEAAKVDLTKDAFQMYALPPEEIQAPKVTVTKGTGGFYEAAISVSPSHALTGVPVKVTVLHGDEYAEVFGATGFPVRLPLSEKEPAGDYMVSAQELLSGLSGEATVSIAAPAPATAVLTSAARVRDANAVVRFAARKTAPLIIALTPDQAKDPKISDQAKALQGYYQGQKRQVTIAQVQPGSVVESLQPLRSPHRYPQWKTVPTDLVLFGTPANNVLLLDQQRGEIFPLNYRAPAAGAADVLYTRSPFVGECDVVNVIAPDLDGLTVAVKTIIALPLPKPATPKPAAPKPNP